MYREVPFAHSVVIVCMRGNCPSLGKNLQTGSGAAAANAPGLGVTVATSQTENLMIPTSWVEHSGLISSQEGRSALDEMLHC